MRRAADGRIYVAGLDMSSGERGDGSGADWFFRQSEFVIRGGTVRWTDEMRDAPELGADATSTSWCATARAATRCGWTPRRRPAGATASACVGTFRQPLLSMHPGRWQDWDGQVYADFARVDLDGAAPPRAAGRRHRRAAMARCAPGPTWRTGRWSAAPPTSLLADVVTRARPRPGAAGAGHRCRAGWAASGAPTASSSRPGTCSSSPTEGQRWPGGNLSVSWTEGEAKRLASGELQGRPARPGRAAPARRPAAAGRGHAHGAGRLRARGPGRERAGAAGRAICARPRSTRPRAVSAGCMSRPGPPCGVRAAMWPRAARASAAPPSTST